MAIQIQLRRGTASQWTTADPTLAVAELGIETDTDKFKVGDGATAWTSLGYGGIVGADGIAATVAAGTTSTGAEGTSASVTNSGTTAAAVFDFTIPKGDSGGITLNVTSPVGGIYIVNGADNPVLSLIRGHRYVINVDAAGHPFYFQTSGLTYDSNLVYTDGVTGSGTDVGTIIFEVPYDAPESLTYVCSNHANMGNSVIVSNLGPTGADGGFDSAQFVSQLNGASYSIKASDKGVLFTNAEALTLTVADVLAVGEQVDFLQNVAGQITFVAGAGVTLNSKDGNLKTAAQYSPASVKCVASGVYVLVGDLGA